MKKLLILFLLCLPTFAQDYQYIEEHLQGGGLLDSDGGAQFDSNGDATSTGILKYGDGVVGAPTFSFKDDTDSGIYRIGTNSIGFSTNGTLWQTITNGGNIQFHGGAEVIGTGNKTLEIESTDGNDAILSLRDTTGFVQLLINGIGNLNLRNRTISGDILIEYTDAVTQRTILNFEGSTETLTIGVDDVTSITIDDLDNNVVINTNLVINNEIIGDTTFNDDIIIQGGVITNGINDTIEGLIYLYGNATNTGGESRWYAGAGQDTTNEYHYIKNNATGQLDIGDDAGSLLIWDDVDRNAEFQTYVMSNDFAPLLNTDLNFRDDTGAIRMRLVDATKVWQVSTTFNPTVDNTYSLGSSGAAWIDFHAAEATLGVDSSDEITYVARFLPRDIADADPNSNVAGSTGEVAQNSTTDSHWRCKTGGSPGVWEELQTQQIPKPYAEMTIHTQTATTTLDVSNTFEALVSTDVVTGGIQDWTFDAGDSTTGTNQITDVENNGGFAKYTDATLDTGVTVGDPIEIIGTTNYNGLQTVTAIATNDFTTTMAYGADELTITASWDIPASIYPDSTDQNGRYEISGDMSGSAATGSRIFEYGTAVSDTTNGVVQQQNSKTQRKIGTAGDVGSFGWGGTIDIAFGDRVIIVLKDIGGTNVFTTETLNFVIKQM